MNAIFLASLFLMQSAPAPPAAHVALLIGIDDYGAEALNLNSPPHDLAAMEEALGKRAGFEIIVRKNPDRAAFIDALLTARERAGQGVVVFYYSGHAISIGGKNFLIPRGARIKTESDVALHAISVAQVLDVLDETQLRVVILDSCRVNPFGLGGKGASPSGLSRESLDGYRGTLISYAAAPGTIAYDGEPGEPSPFTRALVHQIPTAGLDLANLFIRVRGELEASTGHLPRGAQRSEEINSLTEEHAFSFVPPVGAGNPKLMAANTPKEENEQKKKKTKPRLLVLDLSAERGIDPSLVRLLQELMMTELDQAGDYEVIGGTEVKAMLAAESRKEAFACDDTSCLVAIGGALGANFIAHGSVGRVGQYYLINIKLIDVSEAKVLQRVTRQVESDENRLVNAMRRSVSEMLGKTPPPTDVDITADINGQETPQSQASSPVTEGQEDDSEGSGSLLPWSILAGGGIAGAASVALLAGGLTFGALTLGQLNYAPFDPRYKAATENAQLLATVANFAYVSAAILALVALGLLGGGGALLAIE